MVEREPAVGGVGARRPARLSADQPRRGRGPGLRAAARRVGRRATPDRLGSVQLGPPVAARRGDPRPGPPPRARPRAGGHCGPGRRRRSRCRGSTPARCGSREAGCRPGCPRTACGYRAGRACRCPQGGGDQRGLVGAEQPGSQGVAHVVHAVDHSALAVQGHGEAGASRRRPRTGRAPGRRGRGPRHARARRPPPARPRAGQAAPSAASTASPGSPPARSGPPRSTPTWCAWRLRELFHPWLLRPVPEASW